MADWEAAQAVAAAWPSAADALLSRVTTIEDAVAALLSGALDDAEREAARRESHRLAGTLGAFGVASGSVLARDLETAFTDMPDPGSAPQLADRVLALRRAVEAGPPAPAEETSADLRVLIAGLPGPRSGAILRAAEGRNWQVTVARTVGTGGAVAASASSMPEPDEADVILLGRGVGDVPGTVERLARTNVATAALVEDGADRLALIRAGARRLIGAELSAEAIVSELAALAADRPRNLTSVLAVDDDPVSLEIIAAALRAAGHEVTTCSDALDFWNALERSRPDLVALDVEMPGADGIELCRALRADPHWRGTPVLFLTATTSSGAVAELFAAGADDYVPKPVQPAELVARVNGRLERMGQARAGAKLDPATGLLRREAAEPQLEWLLTLAVRLRQRFTVAALAVDAFDALADAERDRALNIAGQVARTVLRTGDIGAVWAGGEIVLGMIGADEHDVRRLIEEGVGGLDTRLTGSAGVAEHPRDGDDLVSLVAPPRAAREAEAKGGGRLAVAGAPSGRKRVDVAL